MKNLQEVMVLLIDRMLFNIKNIYGDFLENLLLQTCKDAKNGDLTTNIAFILAKKLSKSPYEISNALVDCFNSDDFFNTLCIFEAVNGYINIKVNYAIKNKIIADKIANGPQNFISKPCIGKKCLLEFVSSNPTGPLHIGHGRQAVVGDVLKNILKMIGYHVDTEYYVNDAGFQMDILTTSMWLRILISRGIEINFIPGLYQGSYLLDFIPDILFHHPDMTKKFNLKGYLASLNQEQLAWYNQPFEDENIALSVLRSLVIAARQDLGDFYLGLQNFILNKMLSGIKNELAMIGVHIDTYFSERSLVTSKKVEEVLAKLSSMGYTYEKDGALWFSSVRFGDDKDRVLVRSNGEYTYFTNDIAYHLDKCQRGYDRLINLLGSDHHGYVSRIKAAVSAFDHDAVIDIRLVQFVTLIKDGENIAMSTRKANFETLESIVSECGRDAARFFYIEKNIGQMLNFDLSLAKTKAQENPIYYLQYAYARLSRILSKAGSFSFNEDFDFWSNDEQILFEHLSRINEVLKKSHDDLDPCFFVQYLFEFAKKIHSYYNNVPVLSSDQNLRDNRLSLLLVVRDFLGYCLGQLGIDAPSVM